MIPFPNMLALVTVLAAVVPVAWCSPAGVPENSLEVRQSRYLPVTGVQVGGIAPRLEIRQLETRPRMWNLFIQSMERFQNQGQEAESSYYSIAGIHGLPHEIWDDVGGRGGAGYCPHWSNLFVPWHRPYLALIEQRLHNYAVQIAGEFPAGPTREEYRRAANRLRLPYWDWAEAHTPALPRSVSNPQIQVTRPSGRRVTIRNPLFSYTFHPLVPADLGNAQPWASWRSTKRSATGTGPDARSQNGQVAATFLGNYGALRSRIYALFARRSSYDEFSNLGSGSTSGTLEGIHNDVHVWFNRNSHMTDPRFAAYDPIFYMHHANADRIAALWQQLHPNTYVEPQSQRFSTFTIEAGSVQDASSPLTPFHRNQRGDFWTSDSVRTTQVFGYTYPELQGEPSRAQLRARINRLYGPQVVGIARGIASNVTSEPIVPPVLNDPHVPIDIDVSPDDVLHEYAANMSLPINPRGTTYSCALFLGDFNPDPATWATEPNFIGSHAVIPPNGQLNGEVFVPGQIALTQSLLSKYVAGELESLGSDTVLDYLNQKLQYKLEAGGQLLDASQVSGLTVELVSTDVKPRANETDFPTYLESTSIGDITEA